MAQFSVEIMRPPGSVLDEKQQGLAHKGVNVRVLAALAGHKNISTTQRYIEVGEHQLRAAVEMI